MLRSVGIKAVFLKGGSWSRYQYVFRVLSSRCLSDHSEAVDTQDGETLLQSRNNEINSQPNMPRSRTIDRRPEDLYRRYLMSPDQPKNPRLLRVAIIGAPNAGKSSLVNRLMGWKVTGVSKKVHTTRANTNSVFNIDNTQVVLVDTPGVIDYRKGKRHHCESSLIVDPEKSLTEADVVGVIVDAADKWTRYRLDPELLKVLCLHKDVPSFLILNKIDELRNKPYMKQQAILLDITHKLSYGVVGGRSFGRTVGEIKKRKVIDPVKNPDELFDNLEKKYGKLKIRHKNKPEYSVEDMFNKHMIGVLEGDDHGLESDDFGEMFNDEASHLHRANNEGRKYVAVEETKRLDVKEKDGINRDEVGVRHDKSKLKVEDANSLFDAHDMGVNTVKRTLVDNSSEPEVNENISAFSKGILDELNRSDSVKQSEDWNKDTTVGQDEMNLHSSEMDSLVSDKKLERDATSVDKDFGDEHSTTGMNNTRHNVDSLHNDNNAISSVDKEANPPAVESEHIDSQENSSQIDSSKIDDIIKEASYQSNHLANILSKTHTVSTESSKNEKDESDWSEKVDAMKEAIRESRERSAWENFDRVFLTSAIDGTGIDDIKEYLMKIAKPSDWLYHSSVITDQHPYDIAKMCVKQSFLEHIDSYLPYTLQPEIVHWEIDEYNRLNIVMDVYVDNSHEVKMLLKHGGNHIKAVSADARQALMDAFQCDIRFKLIIKQRQKRK